MDGRGLVGGGVVQHEVDVRSFGTAASMGSRNRLNSGAGAAGSLGDHRAARQVQRREQAGGAVADVVMGAPFWGRGQHRQAPGVRSRAWICVFSSTQSTTARSGGFMYRPTMSRTLSMNSGSVDSLKVWTMWLEAEARQIRVTADWDMPAALAMARVDQCVSLSGGSCSSVAMITFSTCPSVTVRGWPGRGSSLSPSSRDSTNRDRHFDTVPWNSPGQRPHH